MHCCIDLRTYVHTCTHICPPLAYTKITLLVIIVTGGDTKDMAPCSAKSLTPDILPLNSVVLLYKPTLRLTHSVCSVCRYDERKVENVTN